MICVSIIVPCRNEATTLGSLLAGIYQQTFPRAALEVIIADAHSADGSRAVVASFQVAHPDLMVRLLDNPDLSIPAGLNRALAAARGTYIVRLDGHACPAPDYVERCVAALEQGRGDMVGGVWQIQPGGPGRFAHAIAAVAAHPLAVGDAQYRYATQAAVVDTVPFGAYRRSLVLALGGYDERLLANEDYELNVRVRQQGGTVWLDPAIRAVYLARPSLTSLARQYWRYGFWKARMLARSPHSLRWRQVGPPGFVLLLLGLGPLTAWFRLARVGLALLLLPYGLALVLVGVQLSLRQHRLTTLLTGPIAMALMHIAWGCGFLWSVCGLLIRDEVGLCSR